MAEVGMLALSDDQPRRHYCAPALIIDSIKMAVKLQAAISCERAVCFRALSHGIIKFFLTITDKLK